MQQRLVDLGGVEHFVLDEADRMLDMGFVHDVKRIAAAVPDEAPDAALLARRCRRPSRRSRAASSSDPVRVAIEPRKSRPPSSSSSRSYFVARTDKRALLERVLRGDAIVARARLHAHEARRRIASSEQLERAGIGAAAIHGNKSQSARERALEAFRRGATRVLVATDIAARGIDVDGISHVINFDLPNVAESYVHRIGRTGRAGAAGRAISFCDRDERGLLADIERFIRRRLPVVENAA